MMVPPEKAEELRRAMEVRAQETTFTTLRQLTYPEGENAPGLRGPLITDDPSGYPTCHTPRSPSDIIFGGVVDDQGILYIGFEAPPGDYGVTYTWTLPQDDSDKPTLVGVEPLGYYINGRPEYLGAQGNTVTVRYEITKRPFIEGSDYLPWDVRVYVNGVVVENLDEFHPGTADLYVLPPVFKSLSHGLHSIHYAAEGGSGLQVGQSGPENESGTLEYFQRGLVFTEPLPDVDPQSDQPVHIQNTVAWSDGAPLEDSAVSWEVRSPQGNIFATKGGTGKQINTTWDPVERTLAQEAEPGEPESEDERFEPIPFVLSARTDVYPDRTNVLLRDLVYEVTSTPFDLPGEIKFKIVNEKIDPDPPFEEPGSSVTLTAELVTINLDVPESRIVWTVSILDPDGNTVGGILDDGIGKDVEATWDGTIGGVPVENPGAYSFHIFAQACGGGDGGGVASRRALESLRLQDGSDCREPLLAQLEVAIGESSNLKLTVTPDSIPPSKLPAGNGPDQEVDVKVELLRMPAGKSSVVVKLAAAPLESSDPERALLYNGGHNHTEGRPSEVFETNSYRFGKPGVFETKLKISEVGGLIRVKAASTDPKMVASANLSVEVPGLVRLPRIPEESTFSGFYLVGGAGDDNQDGGSAEHPHPSNHWGTHDLITAIDEVSTNYMFDRIAAKRKIDPSFNDIGSNVKVLVNDMSLPKGGLFDVGATRWQPSHYEHREGKEVDMITELDPNDDELVRHWIKVTGVEPLVHDGSDGLPRHIHGRMP